MTLTDLILALIILAAAGYVAVESLKVLNHIIKLGVNLMAKTVELTAAVDAAIARLQALGQPNPNVTPDADVQAQIDKLNAAVAASQPTP